jgi:hypothetical protein
MEMANLFFSEVVAQLQDLILVEDDSLIDTPRVATDNMSVVDKMRLWAKLNEGGVSEADVSERFEGVKDDEDEVIPLFGKTTLTSAAYDWFISRLRRECSLQSSNQDRIGQKVLQRLPSGKISKHQAPKTHRVTFRLLWESIRTCLLGDRNRKEGSQSTHRIHDRYTITTSSGLVQVLTVQDYFKQTWSSDALTLVDMLETVSRGYEGKLYRGMIADYSYWFASANRSLCILSDETRLAFVSEVSTYL